MSEPIFSIGHSTRPFDQFLALLRAHAVRTLVDIRSIPRSRRNPQYDRAALPAAIQLNELVYEHLPALGGHRRAREDSPNTGWLNAAFRGYADYMQTEAFEQGLGELLELSQVEGPLAMMCAEAVPWRCHRSMVADALVVRGTSVVHILGPGHTRAHRLNPMARIEGPILVYPSETIPRDIASPRMCASQALITSQSCAWCTGRIPAWTFAVYSGAPSGLTRIRRSLDVTRRHSLDTGIEVRPQ